MTNEKPLALVGIAPCGCVGGACTGGPEMARDRARLASQLVRAGYVIFSKTVEEIRSMPWRCSAHPNGLAAARRARTQRGMFGK